MFEPTEAPATSLRKNQSSDDLVRDAQVRGNVSTILISSQNPPPPPHHFRFVYYQQNYSTPSNLLFLSFHFSSLLLRLQSKCLLPFPLNRKALVLCPMANQASTQALFLKPSPTASSPRLPKAAALSHPHRARHSPYPPSRTLHLQQQYGPSPQSCPPPKTRA